MLECRLGRVEGRLDRVVRIEALQQHAAGDGQGLPRDRVDQVTTVEWRVEYDVNGIETVIRGTAHDLGGHDLELDGPVVFVE